MRAYLAIFHLRFISRIQYRVTVWGFILKGFLLGFMEILMYSAIYRQNIVELPMNFSEVVSYVWMQQVLVVLFLVVFSDEEIYLSVESGSVAYDLVRPIDLYNRWFCQSLGNRVSFDVVNCVPVFFLALLMPQKYRISLPGSIQQWLLFFLSTTLALGVVVSLAMLMYISLFYCVSFGGIRTIVTSLTSFLSGGVIPLAFFPSPVLKIVNLLPFAAMQNMPLQLYCGSLKGDKAIVGICLQIFWLIVLIGIGKVCMSFALRKVIVQGG